ncbi:MAG TPA: IclR family transcriptional regulator C-terminal domain-containing protein, partial [Aeromicrobium sp.]|nr:IclR family transcriptional regulator C-terminal domain-containing protein [Aeromicrobium sp.]
GFAFDDQMFEAGILGVAAPFFDAHGDVLGSVTVTAPTVRREQLLGPVKEQVLKAADDVSAELHAPMSARRAAHAGRAPA